MELKEAKKQVEYFVESLKNDTADIFINNVCNTDAEAIKIVLQALEDKENKLKKVEKYCNSKSKFQCFGDNLIEKTLDTYINSTKCEILRIIGG